MTGTLHHTENVTEPYLFPVPILTDPADVSYYYTCVKMHMIIFTFGKYRPPGGNSVEQSNVNILIAQYLSHCKYEKCLDSKTQKAYKTDLLQFADYILDRESVLSKDNG